ncbi:hypothetical protein KFL_007270020 [Klebsormidium nitens]|uniref:Methyltransferase FkbM domain-containing protein n=1 Tax=Klebsormidium nitens TaxID=105231 RepID=A0A1Y1IJM2_KLENI|nr:hypothetical protein KFL_007270020 [Klebsormidium nitens]|eukprot:GAQ91095.1 hypothetical protein KFL_007270020 [Klebsormidium nitens]
MEIRVGRRQLLGASIGILIIFIYSAALQLHWRDHHISTVAGVDTDSTAQDRFLGYSFSTDPRVRPQLKSGPLLKEIEAILLKVDPEFQEHCRSIFTGKPKSFSQIYQDWFLYHNFFLHIPFGEGFYIDIGANDAFAHSNTLFFDKCLGQLDAVLREHGVSRIDFISLDVEGAELHAVRCFPFDEWNVQAWVVETARHDRFIDYIFLRAQYSKVAELLYRNHFFRHAGRMVDSVYVRNAQIMKYPSLDGPRSFKKWRRELDQDCSDEDRKWNNCDSTTGLPIFELREIDETNGEPKQWCQAQ